MSATTAIVLFAPADSGPVAQAQPGYRAGIVMETLGFRRFLSAAVAAVELLDEPLDDSAIFVDVGETCDSGTDEAGDPAMYELMFTTMDGDIDAEVVVDDDLDDDLAGPDGWGLVEYRLPTQEEIDAANNGDDLGGLWDPHPNLRRRQRRPRTDDETWVDDEEWTDDGEIWTVDDTEEVDRRRRVDGRRGVGRRRMGR